LIFSLLVASLLLPNLAFAEPGTSQVTVNDSTFDVNYDATGLDVTEIQADVESSTVTVFVTTSDVSGTLQITLDRNFFDSKSDGEDDDFLVLTDGLDTTFQESSDDVSRTLTIDVPSGTSSIDIIALGSTSFALSEPAEQSTEEPAEQSTEEPTGQPTEESEEPTEQPTESAEIPEETIPSEETPIDELTCGPGTILQDGECVLQTEPEAETASTAETPKDELTCGPGTILKDGACVLDETCGPGTILVDGTCVLEQTPTPQAAESKGLAFNFIAPIVAAFVISSIIMMILWGIGRLGRNKN
jgi:hypothetical protein